MANGYLIDEFCAPGSNYCTDNYGEIFIENRARFLFEVLDAVTEVVGAGHRHPALAGNSGDECL